MLGKGFDHRVQLPGLILGEMGRHKVSPGNVIITALILNFFIKNADSVGMANYSTFVNLNGALSVKAEGVLCRPQYYVFELLANNTGTCLVDTQVCCGAYSVAVPPNVSRRRAPCTDALLARHTHEYRQEIPFIDAAATADDQGVLYISLVNKHAEEDIEVTLNLIGDRIPAGSADLQTIYAEDLHACNLMGQAPQVTIAPAVPLAAGRSMTILLKKHSINLIRLRA